MPWIDLWTVLIQDKLDHHTQTTMTQQIVMDTAQTHNGFRNTEIGEVPTDWKIMKLGELGYLTDGDWILAKYYKPSGVRLLQVGDVGIGTFIGKSDRYISEMDADELGCTYLSPEQILISRMPDPIGRACFVPRFPYKAITAVDVAILTPDPDVIDSEFAVHALNSPINFSQCA